MRFLFIALLFLPAALWAQVPKVATDIAPVHAMVSQVMKGVGVPSLIIPPAASPHGYAMRPSEARASSGADLVVWIGPELTPWLEAPLDALAAGARRLSLIDVPGMSLLGFRTGEAFGGHSDPDHGHEEHEGRDPHIWLDPANGAIAMAAIADVLGELDAENSEIYRRNAQEGQSRLGDVSTQINAKLAGMKDRPFIVFHDAFHYFETGFGIETMAAVSAGDAAAPGAGRVAALRAHVSQTGAVCAFIEPQINSDLLKTVIEGQNTKLATLDPLGSALDLGPELYADLLVAMAQAMVDCLRP